MQRQNKNNVNMRKEEKDLLIKDLCARLPYGVMISRVVEDYVSEPKTIRSLYPNGTILVEDEPFDDGTPDVDSWDIEEIKPYLRPMSSMTEEELKEFQEFRNITPLDWLPLAHDWLNAHHFDYRGLIEKGLAIEAPKGMYNF